MPTKQTKNPAPNHLKDLFLLFAIPIAIAILAAALIYVPRLLANPTYDFVYSVCESYSCGDSYHVDAAGRIIKREDVIAPAYYGNDRTTLRYYDVKTDSSREFTLGEAQNYRLNSSSKSPDGYVLTKNKEDGGFLFWGSYDESWYLKDGVKKKKVELSNNNSYYMGDIKFMGWVER